MRCNTANNMKEVSEKITERIRKLIRLKESATQIGSEGEAHAAAAAVHRLLMEYNLSLLDLAGENPQTGLQPANLTESATRMQPAISGNGT